MIKNEWVRLIHGDCCDELKNIQTASVDSVITDPPYPEIKRDYGVWTESEWFELMYSVVPELRRVLKPTGSAVFVLQPNSESLGRMRTWLWKFMVWVGDEWGIVQDLWWVNTSSPPTTHCDRRVGLLKPSVKACLWCGPSDCYRNQNNILVEPSDSARKKNLDNDDRVNYSPSGHYVRSKRINGTCFERGGAVPRNVFLLGNSNSQQSHGAQTPFQLCDFFVKYLTPVGGTVLDPFNGSSTVGEAALRNGCRFIGIEKNFYAFKLGKERMSSFSVLESKPVTFP